LIMVDELAVGALSRVVIVGAGLAGLGCAFRLWRRHGNLRFAGEHTSVNYQGYMEGALRSGYRCAREITQG
jgi:monoamine oxidase